MTRSIIFNEFYRLLKLLAANNNKEWFNVHKNEFEKFVFEPFKVLTEQVIFKMKDIDPLIHINYKDAAFRFYRDIRFSKDKSPYKLWMGAVVNRVGRKNTRFPEVYFQFGPGENFIATGLYRPDKDTLHKMRQKIAENPKAFEQINNDKIFRKYFPLGLQGERNKRLSKEYMAIAQTNPLILNKQFYVIAYFDPKQILSADLVSLIVNHYKATDKFNKWLFDLS